MADVFFNSVTGELRELLRKPFREIGKLPRKTKTGKVIQLDYVGHAAVTDRLNSVSPDWTWNLDHVETYLDGEGLPHVAGIVGTLTVGGKSITEGGDPDKTSSYGEELKLAISDFIRRGAMRFGVALDLWSKEELEGRAADKSGAESVGRASPTRRESAAPIGSSGVSSKGEPPGDVTSDVITPSSAAPTVGEGSVPFGEGGAGSSSAPKCEHTEWEPAKRQGLEVCKSCGLARKVEK